MKVVLFCGGKGTRIRDYSDLIPKPLVPIGERPILWHIMKYYAAFGHKDFILCLGYKGEEIKRFFLNYDECITNDFVYEKGGERLSPLRRDIEDWRITFVDTGQDTSIGGRLRRVRRYLDGEAMFLANYSDTLANLDLNQMIRRFERTDAVAGFCCVRPPYTFHVVEFDEGEKVRSISEAAQSGTYINGGYFVLRPEIFDNLEEGDELVIEGFSRLIAQRRLFAYRHDDFWTCMDTFKEKQALDDAVVRNDTPWQVWQER